MTPCMDVYKAKIQSDGIIDKLKLIIVVRGYFQNKEMIGYTCSPTSLAGTGVYYQTWGLVNHVF